MKSVCCKHSYCTHRTRHESGLCSGHRTHRARAYVVRCESSGEFGHRTALVKRADGSVLTFSTEAEAEAYAKRFDYRAQGIVSLRYTAEPAVGD